MLHFFKCQSMEYCLDLPKPLAELMILILIQNQLTI